MRISNTCGIRPNFGTLLTTSSSESVAAEDNAVKHAINDGEKELQNVREWDVLLNVNEYGMISPIFIKYDKNMHRFFGPSFEPVFHNENAIGLVSKEFNDYEIERRKVGVGVKFNGEMAEDVYKRVQDMNNMVSSDDKSANADIIRNSVAVAKALAKADNVFVSEPISENWIWNGMPIDFVVKKALEEQS